VRRDAGRRATLRYASPMPAAPPLPPTPPDDSWTLDDGRGFRLRVAALGAAWISCQVPLPAGANGAGREVLAGFADPADCGRNRAYVGAVLGRYANRIAGGRLAGPSGEFPLACQPGRDFQLHGGPDGFSHRVWQWQVREPDRLRLALESPPGDQGFPGRLHAEVGFALGRGPHGEPEVEVALAAEVDAPCPVNLSHHPYFQLDGRPQDVREQTLELAASRYLPVDARGLPCGALRDVAGTHFDFLRRRLIGGAGAGERANGYDDPFLLDPACADLARPAARLWSRDGRMAMSLWTTLPALQVYTGRSLGSGTAACATRWPDHGAIAIEPQFLPDSPHHAEWPQPDCWLRPGQRFDHRIVYRFEAAPVRD